MKPDQHHRHQPPLEIMHQQNKAASSAVARVDVALADQHTGRTCRRAVHQQFPEEETLEFWGGISIDHCQAQKNNSCLPRHKEQSALQAFEPFASSLQEPLLGTFESLKHRSLP